MCSSLDYTLLRVFDLLGLLVGVEKLKGPQSCLACLVLRIGLRNNGYLSAIAKAEGVMSIKLWVD